MNILHAKQEILDILDNMNLITRIYQGMVDITEHINFQEISEYWNLSSFEHEELINDTQRLINETITNFLNE